MEQPGDKPLGKWQRLKLDQLQHRAGAMSLSRNADGSVTVSLRHEASGRDRWRDCVHRHRYTPRLDGTRIEVDNEVTLDPLT